MICKNDEMLGEWNALFTNGFEGFDVERAFKEAFGEALLEANPSLSGLVAQAGAAIEDPGDDINNRRDLCSSASLASSLSLWEIVVSCIFRFVDDMCTVDNDFEYELKTTTWELPNVRFDYTTSPPPPPPARSASSSSCCSPTPLASSSRRKAMDDVLPTLSQVATSSIGATIGDYKPDAKMTRAELTKAYLATSHLEDQNSLGARWVQAAYTGVWRKACAELVRFFDSQELAGAGNSYSGGQARSDWQAAEHDLPYDRNLFLYAMTEAAVALAIPEDELSALGTGTGFAATAGCGCRCRGEDYDRYDFHAGYRLRQVPPDCELRLAAPAALAAFCARAELRRGARPLPRRRGARDCVRQNALPRQPRARGAAGATTSAGAVALGELPGALLRRGGVDRAARRRRAAAAV